MFWHSFWQAKEGRKWRYFVCTTWADSVSEHIICRGGFKQKQGVNISFSRYLSVFSQNMDCDALRSEACEIHTIRNARNWSIYRRREYFRHHLGTPLTSGLTNWSCLALSYDCNIAWAGCTFELPRVIRIVYHFLQYGEPSPIRLHLGKCDRALSSSHKRMSSNQKYVGALFLSKTFAAWLAV